MTASHSEVLEAVYVVIRTFNRQLPPGQHLHCAPDTALVGEGGPLDSLDLVNLLLSLEDELGQRFGNPIVLLDERLMADAAGPLRTVDSLAAHVATQLP